MLRGAHYVLLIPPSRRGMDYVKNVVNPIRQVAPRRTLRGLREDYGHLTADVVLLTGEVHHERKPVSYHQNRLSVHAVSRLHDYVGVASFYYCRQ